MNNEHETGIAFDTLLNIFIQIGKSHPVAVIYFISFVVLVCVLRERSTFNFSHQKCDMFRLCKRTKDVSVENLFRNCNTKNAKL